MGPFWTKIIAQTTLTRPKSLLFSAKHISQIHIFFQHLQHAPPFNFPNFTFFVHWLNDASDKAKPKMALANSSSKMQRRQCPLTPNDGPRSLRSNVSPSQVLFVLALNRMDEVESNWFISLSFFSYDEHVDRILISNLKNIDVHATITKWSQSTINLTEG